MDVKNAFNFAPWVHIDSSLRNCGVPRYLVKILRSYMENRTLSMRTLHGGNITRSIIGEVPKGSLLGPTLWNVFYNDLLRAEVPEGVQPIGFVDDIAVLAVACTVQ